MADKKSKPTISRNSSEEVANTYEMIKEIGDVDISSDSTQEIIKAPTQSPESLDFMNEKANLIAENQNLRQQLQEALKKLEQEKLRADQIHQEIENSKQKTRARKFLVVCPNSWPKWPFNTIKTTTDDQMQSLVNNESETNTSTN